MIFNRLREYIEPNDLEIHIYKKGIYVVNYTLISSFSDTEIKIENNNEDISIKGKNLVISRLQKDELFISGNIDIINLGN